MLKDCPIYVNIYRCIDVKMLFFSGIGIDFKQKMSCSTCH